MARSLVDLANEGTLSTLMPGGAPIGVAVAYRLDADGSPLLQVAQGSMEAANLEADQRCSLLVQPISWPARRVGSVALTGTAQPMPADDAAETSGLASYKLNIDTCIYTSGLDQASSSASFSGAEYQEAEADALRHAAADLIHAWNSDRAEDIYRIVAKHLGVPLTEMAYAELLWIDHLGTYIRTEVEGRPAAIVRVPFYRPVIDERDARSVLTMSAQIAWEDERTYTPPIPAIFLGEAAAQAGANN